MRRSCQSCSFLVAAQAALGAQQFSMTHVEALSGHGLPFMETRMTEGDAFGASLKSGLAFGVQVNNVGHFPFARLLAPVASAHLSCV